MHLKLFIASIPYLLCSILTRGLHILSCLDYAATVWQCHPPVLEALLELLSAMQSSFPPCRMEKQRCFGLQRHLLVCFLFSLKRPLFEKDHLIHQNIIKGLSFCHSSFAGGSNQHLVFTFVLRERSNLFLQRGLKNRMKTWLCVKAGNACILLVSQEMLLTEKRCLTHHEVSPSYFIILQHLRLLKDRFSSFTPFPVMPEFSNECWRIHSTVK